VLGGPTRWLYEKLGRWYLRVLFAAQFQLIYLVVGGGVLLLQQFVHTSHHNILVILLVSEALAVLENILALSYMFKLMAPAQRWLDGYRSPESSVAAWRVLAGLPLDFLRARRFMPVVMNVVPIAIFVTLQLGYSVFPSLFILIAGSSVVLLYGALLRFFAIEIITRPVLVEVSEYVPPDCDLGKATLPLKARLLLGLPAINIVSGVVVSALSSGGHRTLASLGAGVIAAIAVAFTVSLELSLLLANSILTPLRQLRKGTEAVAAGDFSVRVPVTGSDEAGNLAASFNTMVAGLEERERLREALGAYVEPSVAERVLAEGTTELEGQELEVTVMFVDLRDFTAFAERASAAEVVAFLNKFYEQVVPIITRNGGSANKYVGDGLLAVFGAPEKLPDHADRAVAAALEIVEMVRRSYGDAVRIGVGINSGPVVAGTVGGGGHVEFTVIGDPVNTAARVEAVTRETGDDVLVTEATCCLLQRDHGGFVERPTVELKGKSEPVRLHAPLRVAASPDAGVSAAAQS
jgi:class 3 adenylate cyclase